MSTYQNPLKVELAPDARDHSGLKASVNPDPFVLKYNGHYYAYTTSGEGVAVLHSTDMVNWLHLGYAYQREGHFDYWAPAVFYDNGLFYLYVSSRPTGEQDVHYEYLQVAVSEEPAGMFRFAKQLFATFSIDAHVVRDTDGGLVLFYSTNETLGIDEERPGTVILADRLLDPLTLEDKPQLIVKPTLDEEIYECNRFGDGRDWHTIEGAFYLQRRGTHYVMYSGNAFTKPHYYIGYSTASHQAGVSITQLAWAKHPDERTYQPLLRQNSEVEGVGHNSVVKAPNNIDDWVVYHGRESTAKQDAAGEQAAGDGAGTEQSGDEERRQMRIDPLRWLGNDMWVAGPSSSEQAAPALPGFRDLFQDNEGRLGSDWRIVSGQWQVQQSKAGQSELEAGKLYQTESQQSEMAYGESRQCAVQQGELRQQSVVGTACLLLEHRYYAALFEVNLRWQRHHMGGLYGVVAAYQDEQHHAQVLLDVGKRTIGLYEMIAGVQLTPQTVAVPSGFCFEAYHQLLISIAGKQLVVSLDGIAVLRASLQASLHANKEQQLPCFGLATHYTAAQFAGVSLTGHFSLDETTASELMPHVAVERGAWKVKDGALQGRSRGQGTAIRLSSMFAQPDSKLRFELLGKLGEITLKLATLSAVQHDAELNAGIMLPTAGKSCGTVHVQVSAGRLQLWYDRQLLVNETWSGSLDHLILESAADFTIEALEWTALASC